MNKYVNDVIQQLESDGHKLLYLVKFGSHLYGTNSENSDVDFKGLFLPSKESCLLNNSPKHYSFSSGGKCSKNTLEDVDIQLWSFQYWMQLLGKGETNAIDLLYSHTNRDCVIYESQRMNRVFNNHHSLFTAKKCNAYISYAINNARRFGIKGSRFGAIKSVSEFLRTYNKPFSSWKYIKLSEVIDKLMEKCSDSSYCFLKDIEYNNKKNNIKKKVLFLCGKQHHLDINLEEFYQRVDSANKSYGDRVIQAQENKNVDYKSLSHAVRSLDQMIELLETGNLIYPLKTREEIKRIKYGELTWNEIEKVIYEKLEIVDKLQETSQEFHKYNKELCEGLVVGMYS